MTRTTPSPAPENVKPYVAGYCNAYLASLHPAANVCGWSA